MSGLEATECLFCASGQVEEAGWKVHLVSQYCQLRISVPELKQTQFAAALNVLFFLLHSSTDAPVIV